jgi:uncharacterized protein (TIGR01777 family)
MKMHSKLIMKKIIIAGGTGFLGHLLLSRLTKESMNLIVLTRKIPSSRISQVKYVLWDGLNQGEWTKELEESDVLINLSGKSVNCRYTNKNKRKLIESRVNSTLALDTALQNTVKPPRLWINASSAAYYGFSDKILDENSPAGDDFPSEICKKWEEAFFSNKLSNTRKVALRLAVVLQPNQGLIKPFVWLVKSFFGGKLGSGKQYFTWIHQEDFIRSIIWFMTNHDKSGVYNITAPESITNEEFMRELRKALKIPFGISSPTWLIKIGGKIIGTEPELVLKGRAAIPRRLLIEDFQFTYPKLHESIYNLFENKTN